MLPNKPTILAKIDGKSGTPRHPKKKFLFGFRRDRYYVASAYGRRCVGLRPTPKISSAREKTLTPGTQGR